MRTKRTGEAKKVAKPKANGTPKANGVHKTFTPKKHPVLNSPDASTPQLKSPNAQPTELSERDKERLEKWLKQNEKPYTVATVPLSRKRKRSSGHELQMQSDLFEDRLAVQYEVKPRDKWESLRKYKKFTVANESIATGQCILVKHDDAEDAAVDIDNQWKAKVLEVRALNPEHVFIRVAWLNRPEDLDGGRKPYHGKNELIPTNQMDVIDAMAVNGSLDVVHLDESVMDGDDPLPDEDQYFWRQTYDFANTKTFSELRKICVDDAPQNPDEMILQCSNPECHKWNHVRCFAKESVKRAAGPSPEKKKGSKSTPKKQKTKDPSFSPNSTAISKAENDDGTVIAEVRLKGEPKADDVEAAAVSEIVVTDADDERHTEPVKCLLCGTEIE